MAHVAKRKTKSGVSYAVQFYLNGTPKEMYLGMKYTLTAVNEIAVYVEKLARLIETGGEPDKRTALWLDDMTDDLRGRFESCGLIEKSKHVTLGELWDLFLTESIRRKDSTLRTYETVQKRFFPYFDPDTDPDTITQTDCLEWLDDLGGEYAEASIAGCIQRSTTVFRWAVGRGFIRQNPFEGIPRRSFVNESKRQYIPKEWYLKLLDACPDQTWRTLLAFCRFGGLRNPSETLRIQWCDVNWEKDLIKVTSPKTEHHRGHETRTIPIFPEIKVELTKQFDLAEPGGSPYVIDRWRGPAANLRTQFEKIIFRAGLAQWPDLFQNLRRSRDNELSSEYPAHVAAYWMGHSPQVAWKSYLFPTENDIQRAVTGDLKQNPHGSTGNFHDSPTNNDTEKPGRLDADPTEDESKISGTGFVPDKTPDETGEFGGI